MSRMDLRYGMGAAATTPAAPMSTTTKVAIGSAVVLAVTAAYLGRRMLFGKRAHIHRRRFGRRIRGQSNN